MSRLCKQCSECDGDHHWLEHDPDTDDPDDLEGENQHTTPGYICKHCDAFAAMCDDCDEPIFPATKSRCDDCAAIPE